MEINLNEITCYSNKAFTCCTSSLHSLGKYFPQGSLVLFSKPTSSAQETDLDSCHEREYTGWYLEMRSWWWRTSIFPSIASLLLLKPTALADQEKEGLFFFQAGLSVSRQSSLFWHLWFFPSTDFAGSWSPITPGPRHRANPPSTLHKQRSLPLPHTHLCVFSSSHTHQLIPSFHVSQVSPQIAPVLLVLHDEIQLQPQVTLNCFLP